MFMNSIAAITVSVCSFIGTPEATGPIQSSPPCVVVEDVSVDVAACLFVACKTMKANWSACETAACRTQVQIQYMVDYFSCMPLMTPIETINEMADWIVIEYENGKITYSYPSII